MRICQANLRTQQQLPVPCNTTSATAPIPSPDPQGCVRSSLSESHQAAALVAQSVASNSWISNDFDNFRDSPLPTFFFPYNRSDGPHMVLNQINSTGLCHIDNELLRIVILNKQEDERQSAVNVSTIRPLMSVVATASRSNTGHQPRDNGSLVGHQSELRPMSAPDMRWQAMFHNSSSNDVTMNQQIRSLMIQNQATASQYPTSTSNSGRVMNSPHTILNNDRIASNFLSFGAQSSTMNRLLPVDDGNRVIHFTTPGLVREVQPPSPPPQSIASTRLVLPSCVAQPIDCYKLSAHQCLLREQIEYFAATENDVQTHVRGRNKAITVGQVGIRCKHCAHAPIFQRQRGSTYFPSNKLGIYQAAQNMSTTHLQCGLCTFTPLRIKEQFAAIMADRQRNENGAGRPYWAKSATQVGLIDTAEHGIRFVLGRLPSEIRILDN